MKIYGEWRYSLTILDLGTRWRCGQLYGPAVLPCGKWTSVPIGWALELVWMLHRREKSYPCQESNLLIQSIACCYADWAIPTHFIKKAVKKGSFMLGWPVLTCTSCDGDHKCIHNIGGKRLRKWPIWSLGKGWRVIVTGRGSESCLIANFSIGGVESLGSVTNELFY
jgi:hypothetical protein